MEQHERSTAPDIAESIYETGVLGRVGDWLIVPVLAPGERLHRWGRITEVIGGTSTEPVRYRVRWAGEDHDSLVDPPEFYRIEREEEWTDPPGGGLRRWPN